MPTSHNCTSDHKGQNLFKTLWIVDSGATDHVCNALHAFVDYSVITPISVRLPNGDYFVAKYKGRIHFLNEFYLDDIYTSLISNLTSFLSTE
jgi:hypothetical protein